MSESALGSDSFNLDCGESATVNFNGTRSKLKIQNAKGVRCNIKATVTYNDDTTDDAEIQPNFDKTFNGGTKKIKQLKYERLKKPEGTTSCAGIWLWVE